MPWTRKPRAPVGFEGQFRNRKQPEMRILREWSAELPAGHFVIGLIPPELFMNQIASSVPWPDITICESGDTQLDLGPALSHGWQQQIQLKWMVAVRHGDTLKLRGGF